MLFFYHSNEGLCIVGIAEVIKTHYPDASDETGKWCAVDVKPLKELKRAVSLAEMKKHKDLMDMALIRIGRLSVSPLSEKQYLKIIAISEA